MNIQGQSTQTAYPEYDQFIFVIFQSMSHFCNCDQNIMHETSCVSKTAMLNLYVHEYATT